MIVLVGFEGKVQKGCICDHPSLFVLEPDNPGFFIKYVLTGYSKHYQGLEAIYKKNKLLYMQPPFNRAWGQGCMDVGFFLIKTTLFACTTE